MSADHSAALTGAPPVAGLVLAAGRSTRMGTPKPLLMLEGRSFLGRAVAVLREGGCAPVVAVLPPGEMHGRMGELGRGAGAVVVENPDPAAEQIDSLRLGLGCLGQGTAAAIVLPVDHPKARVATVEALIAAWRARAAPIVRPVHAGRPGHPVLFARDVWAELAEPDLADGAREVVHRHREEIEDVPVEDGGIAVDVNTPAELAQAMGKE